MVHPLPPRPAVVADQRSYPRGVKRAAASAMTPASPVTLITPNIVNEGEAAVMAHSVRVKGDAEVRDIVFDSTGSQFAVSCKWAPCFHRQSRFLIGRLRHAGQDKSVRIFNNMTRAEVAMLQHTAPVVAVAWLPDDSGILSLGNTGIVSKWKRVVCALLKIDNVNHAYCGRTQAVNRWNWAKELDVNEGKKGEKIAPVAMAFVPERIAIVTPKGVRLWIWTNGM